ncbi:choice-of-anchor tandem repeat GloVer-containing protein [Litoribacillus peritrichatus]|uniref:Uncharacterized protein n=1 Tax=Litoribacillus peritrichatus TaxID=718191 RepID=A0ABP7NAY1_9GAMM
MSFHFPMRQLFRCVFAVCVLFSVAVEAADDVKVNYLTSFHGSGPDIDLKGWPQASNPATPPILNENGRLIGMTHSYGDVYSLPPTPSHYLVDDSLYKEQGMVSHPGLLVKSSVTGHYYGSAYVGQRDTELSAGAVFRMESDGTGGEVIASSVGAVAYPTGVVQLDDDDNLYGLDRGPENNGRIFKITKDGAFSVLHTFSAGPSGQMQFPNGMILANNGWLYGVTAYRRGTPYLEDTPTEVDTPVGTLYRINPGDPQSFEILHTFILAEGEIPWFDLSRRSYGPKPVYLPLKGFLMAHLIEAPDGYFYGTTSIGTCWTAGVYNGGDIAIRDAPLCSGKYFPYLSSGESAMVGPYPHYDGPMTHGAVYRMAADGSDFTIIHEFNGEEGSQPRGYLTIADDGYLYGTTMSGGLYKNEPESYRETKTYPNDPEALTYDGTLYRIRLPEIELANDGSVLNSGFEYLHSFKGGIDDDSDGKLPTGVLAASNGRLYGSTVYGGRGYTSSNGIVWQNDIKGTIFEVDLQGDAPGASVSVTVTPGVAAKGENVEVTWSSNSASNCIASGGAESDGWSGNRATAGSIDVSPEPGTYFYILTCDDDLKGGQTSDLITLRVEEDDVISVGNKVDYGNGGGSLSWISFVLLLLLGGVKSLVLVLKRNEG